MKRLFKNKLTLFILLIGVLALVAQSCSTSKKCGCGADINGVYKHPKHL